MSSTTRTLCLCLLIAASTVACAPAPEPAPAAPAGTAGIVDWCGGHGLPESKCTKCNPELTAGFKAAGDWCAGHGFPESACPQCNPVTPPAAMAAAVTDWCGGHGLPESKCTKCNPELTAGFKAAGDWCAPHGFPESACPQCNPVTPPAGLAGAAADWCLEHGLPESQCTKCNRALVEQYRAAGDYCEEHGFPESACPKCQPAAPPAGVEQAALEALVVRLASAEIEGHAGIETVPARKVPATEAIECTAEIAFDADRVADVRAIVPGVVRDIHASLGQRVEAGAPLFTLESTRIGEIQGALESARERARAAKANLTRLEGLMARDIASSRQVEVARSEWAAARAEERAAESALRMTGAEASSPSGSYTITAPIGGALVRRPALVGALATESVSLATIAETSVMWALCDVAEADADRVALGQRAVVTVGGGTRGPIEGALTWIAAEVEPRTRTVAARVEVPNPEGQLRANQFARIRIETAGSARSHVAVPRAAVQRFGEFEVVFVRQGPGLYVPRVVSRRGDGELVTVDGRLRPGELVVTTGAVLLRTEITPGSIGAGCCDVEPVGGE